MPFATPSLINYPIFGSIKPPPPFSKVAVDETEDINISANIYGSILSFICNTRIVVYKKRKIIIIK